MAGWRWRAARGGAGVTREGLRWLRAPGCGGDGVRRTIGAHDEGRWQAERDVGRNLSAVRSRGAVAAGRRWTKGEVDGASQYGQRWGGWSGMRGVSGTTVTCEGAKRKGCLEKKRGTAAAAGRQASGSQPPCAQEVVAWGMEASGGAAERTKTAAETVAVAVARAAVAWAAAGNTEMARTEADTEADTRVAEARGMVADGNGGQGRGGEGS